MLIFDTVCPFNDPNFFMNPWDPCPICGMRGDKAYEGEDDLCIDNKDHTPQDK